jgi:hypothetical protein
MPFFADEQVQPTPGDRGTTTRRRSTRTVRGCEGAWIAQVKEEIAARTETVAVTYYRVRTESRHPEYPGEGTVGHVSHDLRTRAEAEAYAARRLALNGTRESNGWVCTAAAVEEVSRTEKRIRPE